MYNLLVTGQIPVNNSMAEAFIGTIGIFIAICFIINSILLVIAVEIAEKKNCNSAIWFFLVLFFGIIAFVILLALPNPQSTNSQPNTSSSYESATTTWICKTCGCRNGDTRNTCYNCNNPKLDNDDK